MTQEEERISRLLKTVVDFYQDEDRSARQRQIREWKHLKYLWSGISQVWFDSVAHDWRVYEPEQYYDDTQQSYYDKPVNVYRAYLESIIAALSVTVPPIKCYPDDADNSLDLATASAGDEIAKLIYQHNNAPLLWIHALFILCTEGLTAYYNYTDEDEKYGTYEKSEYEEGTETHQITSCPQCGMEVDDQLVKQYENKFNPDDDDVPLMDSLAEYQDLCPNCMAIVNMQIQNKELIVTRLVGKNQLPKSRQCMEVYGGLNVKVPIYARNQDQCPYLFYYYEDNVGNILEEYPDLTDVVKGQGNSGADGTYYEQYEAWGRLSVQYRGVMPIHNRTVRKCWLRHAAFYGALGNLEEDIDFLKKKFPNGCKVVFINDQFAECCNQDLDDHWTLTYNPLSDSIHCDPLGALLVSVQEITNDLVSLTTQTIEHGIGQTFVDPMVLNLEAYRNTEVIPGGIYPLNQVKSGQPVSNSFFQVKTATLSGEVMPFAEKIQSLGQLVSGALPSLFGGALTESNTASEYSMSRSQALQRLQNTWKMMTASWKSVFGKVINQYIECAVEDERIVSRNEFGGFTNSFIKLSEIEGKIGKVELEANENLPITWNQKKDIVMQLLQTGNPEILQILGAPENLYLIREAIGLPEFIVPGEDDRIKQYEEIQLLVQSQPIQQPSQPVVGPMGPIMSAPQDMPSVQIDPDADNHPVHIEICKAWAVSTAGRVAKIENQEGYQNVLLHLQAHQQFMQMNMAPPPGNGAPSAKPNESTSAPIQQDGDINVQ